MFPPKTRSGDTAVETCRVERRLAIVVVDMTCFLTSFSAGLVRDCEAVGNVERLSHPMDLGMIRGRLDRLPLELTSGETQSSREMTGETRRE